MSDILYGLLAAAGAYLLLKKADEGSTTVVSTTPVVPTGSTVVPVQNVTPGLPNTPGIPTTQGVTMPKITSAVSDVTGSVVTWSGVISAIHVETDHFVDIVPVGALLGGHYIRQWLPTETFVCFKAIDANGVVNDIDYVCNNITGLGVAVPVIAPVVIPAPTPVVIPTPIPVPVVTPTPVVITPTPVPVVPVSSPYIPAVLGLTGSGVITNITITHTLNYWYTINWDDVVGAIRYDVEIYDSTGAKFSESGAIGNSNALLQMHPGQTYSIHFHAIGASGTLGYAILNLVAPIPTDVLYPF